MGNSFSQKSKLMRSGIVTMHILFAVTSKNATYQGKLEARSSCNNEKNVATRTTSSSSSTTTRIAATMTTTTLMAVVPMNVEKQLSIFLHIYR